MTLNKELLQKVVDWTAAQERLATEMRVWDQSVWYEENECGTVYCIAGWVAVHDPRVTIVDSGAYVWRNGADYKERISDYAADRLGLTSKEDMNAVFDGNNTAADVKGRAIRILNDAQAEENSKEKSRE